MKNLKIAKGNNMCFRIFALIAVLACFLCACGKEPYQEEPIIYGTIDEDAEIVEQIKPPKKEQTTEIVGNTYLNLLNGGLFCEDEDYWFYVIDYQNEKYLLRKDKKTDDVIKIFKGNIRNLFVIDGWVYGIVHEPSYEHMIVMDSWGNNIFRSQDYKYEVRSMISDGGRIYFTVDASNRNGMNLSTSIFSCDLMFEDIIDEKKTDNVQSQVDVLTIKDGYIYFNETYRANDSGRFKEIPVNKREKPIIIGPDKYIAFDNSFISNMVNEAQEIISINVFNDKIFIVSKGISSFIVEIGDETKAEKYKEGQHPEILYESRKGLISYRDGKYKRLQ